MKQIENNKFELYWMLLDVVDHSVHFLFSYSFLASLHLLLLLMIEYKTIIYNG